MLAESCWYRHCLIGGKKFEFCQLKPNGQEFNQSFINQNFHMAHIQNRLKHE